MRRIDHKDMRKHIVAIRKIRPCCTAKMVEGKGDVAHEVRFPDIGSHKLQTARFLVEWFGRRIRVGLAIGGVVDGEPALSNVGSLCLDQWMRSYPSQQIVFAEFKNVATGNIERLRAFLMERLDGMAEIGDDAVLMLVAKNSTMYDKIGALIGIGKVSTDTTRKNRG